MHKEAPFFSTPLEAIEKTQKSQWKCKNSYKLVQILLDERSGCSWINFIMSKLLDEQSKHSWMNFYHEQIVG
jgi:hypothetical protein